MTASMKGRVADAGILLLVLVLPLIGAAMRERDLSTFVQFPPPLEIPNDYQRFSWLAAGAVIVLFSLLAGSWIVARRQVAAAFSAHKIQPVNGRGFPWWGWLAIAWTISWWVLAWTRWSWFEAIQRYTFFPLWLGFIVVVNASTEARTKTCLMRRVPVKWLGLFGVSALFWWLFEWLNRFVQNWHYIRVADFDAAAYLLHASLCFSTVLPAVTAVAEWLNSHPWWINGTASGPRWRWLEGRATAITLLIAGAASLILTGAYPRVSYPALWVAPLSLVFGASILLRRDGPAEEMSRGDWRRAASWMTAAFVCGIFWEMWNWRSAAKWIYTIPGVERWYIFEMPLLGYIGYLPFGLQCLLVVERVLGERWSDWTRRVTTS